MLKDRLLHPRAESTAPLQGRGTRLLWLTVLVLQPLVVACGSEDHPAPIGSSGGSGGAVAGASGAAGSAGTSSGGTISGGAGGTAGDGGSGGVTPLETFDPSRVYVQGTNLEGDCHTWVVALPESPGDSEGTFPCDNSQLSIRPSDGALAYAAAPGDYRLWETDFVQSGFPPNPETNDVPLPAPDDCNVVEHWFQDASSERVVACEDGRILASSGELDLQGDALLAVGKDGVLLSAGDSGFNLRRQGAVTAVELGSLSLTPSQVTHARAFGDGFLLLEVPTASTPAPALRIAPDGSVTQLADYPAVTGSTVLQACRLEPSGVAVCLGLSGANPAVFRFDSQGTSAVVYQQSAGLFLDGARLFTGP